MTTSAGQFTRMALLAAALLAPAIQSAQSQTTTISVPNTSPWSDTGIDIPAGAQVSIVATGIVYYGVLLNVQYADANGVGPEADGTVMAPNTPLPGAIAISLIGKIGGSTTVGTGTPVPEGLPGHGAGFVGSSYNRTIPTAGRLFLGYNDNLSQFGDNSGAFTVAVTVPPPSQGSISVPSTAPWFDTGINIPPGAQVSITATGIVYYGVLHTVQYADANGVGPEADGTVKTPNTPLPDAIAISLIGKIGGSTAVGTGMPVPEGLPGHGAGFVGSSYNQTIPTAGRLFLGYNDNLSQFGDNSGAFSVSITVGTPASLVTFFPSPGTNANGDRAFQTAVSNRFVELDLEQYAHNQYIDLLDAGDVRIDVNALDAANEIASPTNRIFDFNGGYPGTTFNRVLTSTGQQKVEFLFSPPVFGFGTWLFDDGARTADQFVMAVTVTGGATFASSPFDSGNGTAHAVEGFLGAVSPTGIVRVVISVERLDGSPTTTGFEMDHLQIAPFPLLQLNMYAGLKIFGPTGATYRIESLPAFGPTNVWNTLTNVTLPSSPYLYIDLNSPSSRQQFYRAVRVQ